MVCPRCIMAVREILSGMGIDNADITLGEVNLINEMTNEQLSEVKERLQEIGFNLLSDSRQQIVETIKTFIIDKIQSLQGDYTNFSILISNELHKDYSQLSKLFSSIEGITIEQYIILQRVEKAKELLTYGEKTLSEIAYALGYSSVAHLSAQFKKITGMTPSQFKKHGCELRKGLDAV